MRTIMPIIFESLLEGGYNNSRCTGHGASSFPMQHFQPFKITQIVSIKAAIIDDRRSGSPGHVSTFG
jgi:hypothetical protein